MSQPSVQPEEVVQFTEFLEIENICKEITDISTAAERNKEICNALKQRVCDATLAVLDLKVKEGGDNNKEVFNKKKHFYLQNLISIMKQIKNFMLEISQQKTFLNFIRTKNIGKTFKGLCSDFDICVNYLLIITTFTTIIIKRTEEKDEEEQELLEKFKKFEESEEFEEFKEFKEFINDAKSLRDDFSSLVLGVDKMANMCNIKVQQVQQLKFSDFEKPVKDPRKGGRVTKWVDVRNKCEEFAFKDISENKNSVQNQVIILKELHDCQNVIKFYGITCDGNKWYSITEWAEYGNLREFYTNHKHLFDIKLKLRMSLDIARGLNFLRSLEIVHRDIRAENVLITLNDTAKLANFELSRKLRAATFISSEFKQIKNLERDRYCAPELLEKDLYRKYDYKCEVYSFGILLWEIAEEKAPYKDYDGIITITNLVRNEYRESFSENSAMPEKFKDLSRNAVNHDPESRPKVTTMFDVLCDCFESFHLQNVR